MGRIIKVTTGQSRIGRFSGKITNMHGLHQRFVGLCLVPMAFCILDSTLTLLGQSSEYWSGNRLAVNEGSPTFHQLLSIHPAAFILGIAVWISIFVGIILLLPETPALILSIATVFGHTVGAATWILYGFQFGYQMCNGLFLLAALSLGLGIRFGWQAAPREPMRFDQFPAVWRWIVIAALFGTGVYLFLWPRTVSS